MNTFKKLTILLLVSNLCVIIFFGCALIGILNDARSLEEAKKERLAKDFRFLGGMLQRCLTNDIELARGMIRIHHFAEPHTNKFYPFCPHCQEDKGAITEDEKNPKDKGEVGKFLPIEAINYGS